MNISSNIKNFLYDANSYVLLCENSIYLYGCFKILYMDSSIIELQRENELITIKGKELKINKSIDNEMLIIGTINEIKR